MSAPYPGDRARSYCGGVDPVVERPDMPDYGVTGDVAGALPWSWAEERLARTRNYWLVTVAAGGRPHSLPVWGVWRSEPAGFVFSCAPGARKARNLRENPQACVTIDDTVECVSVEGRARPVTEADEIDAVVAAYVAKYAAPGEQQSLGDFVRENLLWAVAPERAFGIIERPDEFAARATRWRWAR